MRTFRLHFPDDALPTLDTFLKLTKEVCIFRRAQAVREVIQGRRMQNVLDALQFTYSALRKWVHRFATQSLQGLVDRPPLGRPTKRPRSWRRRLLATPNDAIVLKRPLSQVLR